MDAEKLERAVQAAEQALQKDAPLPPPSLFDELRDSVFSSLLPYWACFQKAWLQRSPTSAQRAPGRALIEFLPCHKTSSPPQASPEEIREMETVQVHPSQNPGQGRSLLQQESGLVMF